MSDVTRVVQHVEGSGVQNRNTELPTNGRSRLIDVAQMSGVTKSVASRVLNDDATLSVREETRLRVLESAKKLGYQPHVGARALAGSRTRALALLIPDLTNPVYSRITRGAYSQARNRGYALLLAEDTAEEGVDEQFADLVASGRVDGLLIASARPSHPLLNLLPQTDIPYLFVNRSVADSGRNITMNLEAASTCAVAHLQELGHRHIGHVSGPEALSPGQGRRIGLLRAAREAGLPEPQVEPGEFSEKGGYDATLRLIRNHPRVTAVYTSTLNQAIGALHALHESGISVPEQISVISYDDLPLADYLQPPLTTIAMPLVELGRTAVDVLCNVLNGDTPTDLTIPSDPQVVSRRSTAPPLPSHP
ncbi:LacI family DNA-binding transcriptional regulator [Paenarthrobacter sp. OM7]|uniref:LacI family DNA-binding transcriptional regulator n=1 Tax=Paenarthrobacter sp. AMU7 TaxID=3162492 RepID=A0AB39YPE1_9MICC|nr:LacI family DNA-binding transcriptional regulator [Paenarthrobacter sp. OM7]WGM20512.1 LacI family DNA-binding transcriptional regulator [Paenarthrobacter sp. OM7]